MLVVKMFVSIDQIYNIKKCMKEGWQFNEIFTSQIKISYRNEIMLAFTDGKKINIYMLHYSISFRMYLSSKKNSFLLRDLFSLSLETLNKIQMHISI